MSTQATPVSVVTPAPAAAIAPDAGRPLRGPDGRPASGNVIGRFSPPQ